MKIFSIFKANNYKILKYFSVTTIYAEGGTDAGETPLILKNLPTSATGLPSGAVWRDASNFLRVVP